MGGEKKFTKHILLLLSLLCLPMVVIASQQFCCELIFQLQSKGLELVLLLIYRVLQAECRGWN